MVTSAGSHTRTDRSSLADAIRVPSGDHATPNTQPVWPAKVIVVCPVAGSHTRTDPFAGTDGDEVTGRVDGDTV